MSADFPSDYINPAEINPAEEGARIPPKRRGLPSKTPLSGSQASEIILPKPAADQNMTGHKAKPLPTPYLKNEFIPFLPGPTLPPIDYILSHPVWEGSFLKAEHYTAFDELFGVHGLDRNITNMDEIKIIYRRMVRFAGDSGIGADLMVANVMQGRLVAKEIASGDFTREFSAHDLAALDWFLRSQHAKMDQLYLKGTMKFPDPDHHFAQFLLQVRGQYQGKGAGKAGPYPRLSSHLPEESREIKFNLISCKNGEYICFSKRVKFNLMLRGKVESNKIHYFNRGSLGIDVSGKNVYPPGKGSETYLFHLFNEKDQRSHLKIPVVELKSESSSVAPIDRKKTWGSPTSLLKDKVEHGSKLYKKMGSSSQKSLKEDKLPPSVCSLLDKVKVLKGEKGSILRKSYEALKKTTAMGNDAALTQLKRHLELQLIASPYEKEKIEAVLKEIEAVFQQSITGQGDSKYLLLPRGQEVILPTLAEMLENKVKFVGGV
jgi:hypothetical protein